MRKFEIGKYNYKNDKCVKFNIQNKPRNVFQNVEIIKYALSWAKKMIQQNIWFFQNCISLNFTIKELQ